MTQIDQTKKTLLKSILTIAVPISLQSLFQSSLSVIDQIMVGQLGTESITSIGLGAKFPNFFMITLAAVGTSSSIMISQYCGAKNWDGVNKAFFSNGFFALAVMALFFLPSALFPRQIIGMYTADPIIVGMGADYLRITAIGYIPLLGTTMVSSLLRNTGYAKAPMLAGIVSVFVNTFLNYVLIFGNFGAPKLGVNGTAIATTVARFVEFFLLICFFFKVQSKAEYKISTPTKLSRNFLKQTLIIASPIILNEFLWGFGDTMYAVVYGHMGTEEMAAMTLTAPIQSLSVGLFTGISTAAAILVGNCLGREENGTACTLSRKFLQGGIVGSLAMGVLLCIFSNTYADLFRVPSSTKQITVMILYVFSALLFVKVTNMILAGGILRSGGVTKYTLYLDVLGTWCIGIPLGFLSAFVWHLPIAWVYFFISTEEIVRLVLGSRIFTAGKWMRKISAAA